MQLNAILLKPLELEHGKSAEYKVYGMSFFESALRPFLPAHGDGLFTVLTATQEVSGVPK
jgi:hypothetical protein